MRLAELDQAALNQFYTEQSTEVSYVQEGRHNGLFVDKPEFMLRSLHTAALVSLLPGQRCLDAGSGSGINACRIGLKQPAAAVIGVDLGKRSVQFANNLARSFGVRAWFQRGDVERLPFADASFDWIVCTEVLEHLVDPSQALSELRRVGKADARYVFSVPWAAETTTYAIVHLATDSHDPSKGYEQWYLPMNRAVTDQLDITIESRGENPVHIMYHTHYAPKDFKRLLAESGYQVDAVSGSDYGLRVVWAIQHGVRRALFRRMPMLTLRLQSTLDSVLSHTGIHQLARPVNLFAVASSS